MNATGKEHALATDDGRAHTHMGSPTENGRALVWLLHELVRLGLAHWEGEVLVVPKAADANTLHRSKRETMFAGRGYSLRALLNGFHVRTVVSGYGYRLSHPDLKKGGPLTWHSYQEDWLHATDTRGNAVPPSAKFIVDKVTGRKTRRPEPAAGARGEVFAPKRNVVLSEDEEEPEDPDEHEEGETDD